VTKWGQAVKSHKVSCVRNRSQTEEIKEYFVLKKYSQAAIFEESKSSCRFSQNIFYEKMESISKIL
jgi:hypothetical protein